MNTNELNVELLITYKEGLKGSIIINNQQEKPIIINHFVWGVASLILKLQNIDGNPIHMPPPPMPPANLDDYETIIKSNDSLEIPIQGIDILLDKLAANGLKVRVEGYYKNSDSKSKEVEVFSEWIFIDKTIFDE